MRGNIERTRRLWKPYEWSCMSTAYGMIWGRSWTKRGGIRKAEKEWAMFVYRSTQKYGC